VLDSLAAPAWWRYVTYVVGFLTFATLAALGELNGLLQAMHVPGAASYGIGGLSDFGLHRPHAQTAYDVVLTWCGGQSSATTSVFTIAHWEIVVDCIFALLYPTLAAIILLKTHRRLGRIPVPSRRASLVPLYRRIAVIALCAAPVVAVADLAENVFEWQVVGAYDACPSAYGSTPWFWALWIAAVVKYTAGLVVALGVLLVTLGVVLVPEGAPRRIGRALVAARGPVVAVGLFAALVLFDPTGQAGDTIRRWADDPQQATAATGFAILLGWVSGLEAKRVLGTNRPAHDPPSRAALGVLLAAGRRARHRRLRRAADLGRGQGAARAGRADGAARRAQLLRHRNRPARTPRGGRARRTGAPLDRRGARPARARHRRLPRGIRRAGVLRSRALRMARGGRRRVAARRLGIVRGRAPRRP
jgi:hypothetical protein